MVDTEPQSESNREVIAMYLTLLSLSPLAGLLFLSGAASAETAPPPAAVAGPVASSVPAPDPMPPKQALIQKSLDLKSGKIDASVYRIVFPRGFKTPVHVRQGSGPRYVVKGRVRIVDSARSREYGPGEVFWETGETMMAENISDGEAELIIFEIAPTPTRK